ncbi:MAG: mannose-1-phosphate guanylyltransferase [Candidatus Cryptobacteroides sp.]
MNHIVIMAGGIGSRFWPLSTAQYPKQFIDILGCGSTMIQMTVDRFRGIALPENIWVVTNRDYVGILREQLPQLKPEHILAEPAARNTAPCIAWACWSIRNEDPGANVVVTPSDAVVLDAVEFRRVISNALAFTASKDAVVTIGIRPTRPETGYGYVETGDVEEGEICSVKEFKEKPDIETAGEYLASGRYLWNAGIFVWNVGTITDMISAYKPNIAADMDEIIATGDVETIFPACEKISIDFAVMEPASREGRVFTHPADFGWSDLGNWASLHDKLETDADGNAAVGNVSFYDCKDCVVHVEDAEKVVLQGLDGYIVSAKNGRILVCRRSEEQRIKDFQK